MEQSGRTTQFAFILSLSLFLLLFAACGSDRASSDNASASHATPAAADNNAPAVATMPVPQGNFKAAAENQITTTTKVSTTSAASQTQTTNASADDLARGNRSYIKNKCSDCHGERGEVMAGKTTKAIGGTTLTVEQFDQFLRTGGGLGDSHIFGPGAISPGGMQVLYAYVKSLPGK